MNQWIASEKQELATAMERYNVKWLQKGTHEKHLSVLEFEKKERARKVAEFDSQKQEISSVVAQLGRSFEFSLPRKWSRTEQIEYTTDFIQRNFVEKGMCADWSIHDKGDGNPHIHLLVTMRPFKKNHTWGNKETKDWAFARDEAGNIVIDEMYPDW